MGRVVFGQFGMLTSTITAFAVFGTLGLSLAATKHVAEFRAHDPARAGGVIGLALLFGLVVGTLLTAGLAWWSGSLSRSVLNESQLAPDLRLSSLLIVLYAVSWAQGGCLQGFEAFRELAWLNIARAVVVLPGTLGLMELLGGLRGAVLGLVAGGVVLVAGGQFLLQASCRRHGIRPSLTGAVREWRVLHRFSIPALLGTAMIGPVTWVANAVLVRQADGYAELGLLNVAYQWRAGLGLIPALFASVSLPLLASLRAAKEHDACRDLLRRNIRLTMLVVAALSVPICIASPQILRAYGKEFSGSTTVFLVMIAATYATSYSAVLDQGLLSAGRAWTVFMISLGWGVGVIGLCVAMAERGAVGIALAFLIAAFLRALTGACYAKRVFNVGT